eukprot:CAMPEP_0197448870 /NCGR_PEP_ID=MMETSP1175-20131217/19312_1 /TAXON_ID=1003142 /ORGANISM="Triceratium dubium, Strain CCMP147" /LENGTH=146 /DNA_ID=CAMNT_0042980785 /DNA_START=35 /DNA_END=475 /DNA_ORIENTATION=+
MVIEAEAPHEGGKADDSKNTNKVKAGLDKAVDAVFVKPAQKIGKAVGGDRNHDEVSARKEKHAIGTQERKEETKREFNLFVDEAGGALYETVARPFVSPAVALAKKAGVGHNNSHEASSNSAATGETKNVVSAVSVEKEEKKTTSE